MEARGAGARCCSLIVSTVGCDHRLSSQFVFKPSQHPAKAALVLRSSSEKQIVNALFLLLRVFSFFAIIQQCDSFRNHNFPSHCLFLSRPFMRKGRKGWVLEGQNDLHRKSLFRVTTRKTTSCFRMG